MGWLNRLRAIAKGPELLFRGTFSYDFDGIPLSARNLPAKKRLNLLKCGIDMLLTREHLLGLPPSIQVEPTNVCNLECPLCPTGSSEVKRPQGFMSLDLFNKLLDELGEVLLTVILYSWGEPFLNKNFFEMVEACSKRDILTVTSTNGNVTMTEGDASRLVDVGLTALIIAMDGSTQDIYQVYRRKGEVEKVKHFAAILQEAKAKRGSGRPYTNLRVVVNNHNRNDLRNIEQIARDLKVDFFSIKSAGDLTANTPFNQFETDDKDMRRYEYTEKNGKRKKKDAIKCPFPFRQPTVFWDGTVVGCEFDYKTAQPWGRIGDSRFADIWNSKAAIRHRAAIMDRKGRPAFCDECCPYRDRIQNSCILHSTQTGGERKSI